MVNLLDRIAKNISGTKPPKMTQVFDSNKAEEKVEDIENLEVSVSTVVKPLVVTKTIKNNTPGTPLMGFTLQDLANELGTVLEKSMHKAGVNSVDAEIFGVFNLSGVIPDGFILIEDEYIGKSFLVLNNSNRMTEIFKSVVKAISSTTAEVISFPYLTEVSLELPLKYDVEKGDFIVKNVKTSNLYLTPKEIENLNYRFIKEINFCAKTEAVEGSIDLLSMQIDREEWKAAPYRE